MDKIKHSIAVMIKIRFEAHRAQNKALSYALVYVTTSQIKIWPYLALFGLIQNWPALTGCYWYG